MKQNIVWEDHGVYCAFTGDVVYQNINSVLIEINKHDNYEHFRYTIYDFSAARTVAVADGDITKMLAHTLGAAYSNPTMKTALIGGNIDHVAVAETLKSKSKRPVELFQNLEEARAWLQGPA
jgi:hypothetical protein